MTHLYIEQNTGLTEEVNNSIISKLYELAISGDLDETSDLKGRLHTPSARDIHVSYLTTHFPELYITADAQYITLADPDLESFLAGYIGNGETIVQGDIQQFILSGKKFGENYYNPYKGSEISWSKTFDDAQLVDTFNEFGTLFNGLTKIYQNTFKDCRNLSSITLPSTVTEIGNSAFQNTYALTSLNLENIESIGDDAFYDSHIGGDISLPNLTYIGGTAFKGTRITSISLPTTITLGGDSIFGNCSNLTQVTGLSTITNCKSATFFQCGNLETIDVDFSIVTKIGGNTFNNCQKLNLGNLVLPNLTQLGDWTFQSCKKLYSVDLSSSSITTLHNGSFSGCSNLTTVVLPANCTIFDGRETFQNCSSLTSINTGNITKFGNNTFQNCTSLQSVDFSSATHLGNRCFSQSGITGQISIPNYLGKLEDYAFYGTTITSISLSSGCTGIGQNAFENCSNLQTISNIDGITSIGYRAFYNCSNLVLTKIPDTVTGELYQTFYNCSKITVNSSNNVTLLREGVFRNCTSITSFTIKNICEINGRAIFRDCTNLEEVIFEQGNGPDIYFQSESGWDGGMFVNTKITKLDIPERITYFGSASMHCSTLRTLIIRKTTVPEKGDWSLNSNVQIYVPDASVQLYKDTWTDLASRIHSINELPS